MHAWFGHQIISAKDNKLKCSSMSQNSVMQTVKDLYKWTSRACILPFNGLYRYHVLESDDTTTFSARFLTCMVDLTASYLLSSFTPGQRAFSRGKSSWSGRQILCSMTDRWSTQCLLYILCLAAEKICQKIAWLIIALRFSSSPNAWYKCQKLGHFGRQCSQDGKLI